MTTVEWTEKYLNNFRNFAEKYLKIKDKETGKIIPFKLNTAQRIVDDQIEKLEKAGKPIRLVILKARQFGISTYFAARNFWRTAYKKNRKSAIIGHKGDATDNLAEMVRRNYRHLPEALQTHTKLDNKKGITFDKIESEVILWTAEGGDVGSSHTVQDCHITELAKWRDPETSMTSLLQTIPYAPNTSVTIESTAKGFGNEFYDYWVGAVNGENKFIPIFLCWFTGDEYTEEFASKEAKQKLENTLDDEEKNLLKLGATLEHLNWRREIGLPINCKNDLDRFHQEYPSYPEEAFLTSGRPVFDTTICNNEFVRTTELKKRGKTPLKTGDLVYKYDDKENIIGVEFVENPRGFIKQYLPIVANEREQYVYCGGADVAEGLEQGDYSAMYYLDRRVRKIALSWHGHIDPDLLAEEQHKIQMYLGSCYVNTEVNNHGLTTVNRAYQLGVNQYYREDFEMGYEVQKDRIGFKTTSATKPILINNLNEAIREREFSCNSPDFWKETLTFVKNERGQMQAQNKDKDLATKCYDDRVLGMSLMWKCHIWLPRYRELPEPEIYARPPIVGSVDSVVRF